MAQDTEQTDTERQLDTLVNLTPHPIRVAPKTLSLDDVGAASTAMAWAARFQFVPMRNVVAKLSPEAAADLHLAAEILAASLAHRAYGRGRPTPPLVAAAVLTPDDPRLPGGET